MAEKGELFKAFESVSPKDSPIKAAMLGMHLAIVAKAEAEGVCLLLPEDTEREHSWFRPSSN